MIRSQVSIKILGVHFGSCVLDNSNWDKTSHRLAKKNNIWNRVQITLKWKKKKKRNRKKNRKNKWKKETKKASKHTKKDSHPYQRTTKNKERQKDQTSKKKTTATLTKQNQIKRNNKGFNYSRKYRKSNSSSGFNNSSS